MIVPSFLTFSFLLVVIMAPNTSAMIQPGGATVAVIDASPPSSIDNDSYEWPENLYLETRDMAAVSFLVYSFGWLQDVARKQGGLKGLQVDQDGHLSKESSSTKRLYRSFTPTEVNQIIQDNRDVLAKEYPEEFKEGSDQAKILEQSLQIMQERAVKSGLERPIQVIEFDDHHQDKEMVYAVAKDDVSKRITLVFRGTENALAFKTNWLTNFSVLKEKGIIPDAVKDVDEINFHGGFYSKCC